MREMNKVGIATMHEVHFACLNCSTCNNANTIVAFALKFLRSDQPHALDCKRHQADPHRNVLEHFRRAYRGLEPLSDTISTQHRDYRISNLSTCWSSERDRNERLYDHFNVVKIYDDGIRPIARIVLYRVLVR